MVEWYTNATTALPSEGEKLDGELTLGSLRLAVQESRPGRWRSAAAAAAARDPKDDQRIVRQHAQKCAVELLKTAHELGLLAPASDGETPLARVGELVTMVKVVAEHLEAHVYRGMDAPIKIDGFDVVPRQRALKFRVHYHLHAAGVALGRRGPRSRPTTLFMPSSTLARRAASAAKCRDRTGATYVRPRRRRSKNLKVSTRPTCRRKGSQWRLLAAPQRTPRTATRQRRREGEARADALPRAEEGRQREQRERPARTSG
jgi:hypothetical protein